MSNQEIQKMVIKRLLVTVGLTAFLSLFSLAFAPIINAQEADPACTLTFNIGAPPTGTPTPTPNPTPTPTPIPECWDTCSSDSDCPSSLDCQDVSGTNRCVNPSCPAESDCTCPSPTSTPTPTSPPPPPGSTSTPAPKLPEAGIISPTILATLGGLILVILGLLL